MLTIRGVARRAGAWLLLVLGAVQGVAHAEPYIAVREGFACGLCHVNPIGGGMRTVFGDLYAQNLLPQQTLDMGSRGPWTGNVGDWLRVGGDYRGSFTDTRVPGQKTTDEFATTDFRVYGAIDLIQNRLTLYADQLLAPGGSANREAWGLLWFGDHHYYVKGGRLYVPFGLRLQDDKTFVREASGVNFTTPDNGIELGLDHAPWTAQLSVSNGAGGGSESDRGKQVVLSGAYVQPRWRVGASGLFNDDSDGERSALALFSGFKTGPLTWLVELDRIQDRAFATGKRTLHAGLLEANWLFLKGHNLKVGAEYLDPDTDVDHDAQTRYGAIWEWSPIQFLQARVGYRRYDGIPQNDLQNRKEAFVEAHVFF